jgi:hypothetical protein
VARQTCIDSRAWEGNLGKSHVFIYHTKHIAATILNAWQNAGGAVSDTRNHYLLDNPTDALMVCSRVLLSRILIITFQGNFRTSHQRHTHVTCGLQAALWPLLYYINVYITCKSTYMYMWVPPINILSDIPENGHVGQCMLEDNKTQLWLRTSMYFVGYTVIHAFSNFIQNRT